jgi:hypothetical protein
MKEIKFEVRRTNGEIAMNFDEVRSTLMEGLKEYRGLVFTEETKADAKKTVAELRKLKKTVDDKRKEVKTSFLEPYNEFERRVKELESLIDEPIDFINGQLDGFEQKRLEERRKFIQEEYDRAIKKCPYFREFLTLDRIYEKGWENASLSEKNVSEAILRRVATFSSEDFVITRRTEAQPVLPSEAHPVPQDTRPEGHRVSIIPVTPEKPVLKPGENAYTYEIHADAFQIAQLEAAMREFGITWIRRA